MTIKKDMIENLKQLKCLDNDELLNSKKKFSIGKRKVIPTSNPDPPLAAESWTAINVLVLF